MEISKHPTGPDPPRIEELAGPGACRAKAEVLLSKLREVALARIVSFVSAVLSG